MKYYVYVIFCTCTGCCVLDLARFSACMQFFFYMLSYWKKQKRKICITLSRWILQMGVCFWEASYEL